MFSFPAANSIKGKESLVTIQPKGNLSPFFLIGDYERDFRYHKLVEHLGEERPVYEFKLPFKKNIYKNGLIKKLATSYLRQLLLIQPQGPYLIGGSCRRGVVAFEMAQQLISAGHSVELLALFEVYTPKGILAVPSVTFWKQNISKFKKKTESASSYQEKLRYLNKKLKVLFNIILKTISRIFIKRTDYTFKAYPGKIILFKSRKEFARSFSANDPYLGWRQYCRPEKIEVIEIPGRHGTILEEPGAQIIANHLINSVYKASLI